MSKNKIHSKLFKKFGNIVLLHSTKKDGPIGDATGINNKNLDKMLSKFKINSHDVVFMEQVHGRKINMVKNTKIKIVKNVDGLVTNKKNIFLCIKSADCLPIVFYEPITKTIAVVHAGYKGILKGVIEKTIEKLEKIQVLVQNVYVYIGPSIGKCCYSVGKDRIIKFRKKGIAVFEKKADDYFLDLKNIAHSILLKKGLQKNKIEISSLCTKCSNSLLFSYRAHKTEKRFITIIGRI
ncbi:peptidoglycan editing factor PgeF [Candidatus Parcubacteria bacterium]|nr:MAG: peptidoglycan editing factor PgeF [Candidatus Parcubacteria bacterium]